MKQYVRNLPPVHELQRAPEFSKLLATYSLQQEVLTLLIQEKVQYIRQQLLTNAWDEACVTKEQLTERIFTLVEQATRDMTKPYLQKVINATGTVLHTNLGRARLSEQAIAHMTEVASCYSNIEYNVETGKRGSRHDVVEQLICNITGAEAAMVVNNNAAAVFLVLRALAGGKEVIVSRGQLVEIGGSFRISSIMEESGATLREVGTTNKTHLHDYERAICEQTAMLMKVHTSNFKIVGFTKTVETKELIALKKQYDSLIYYEDLGSGDLFGYRHYGIGEEPVVREVLAMGADLVSFSGDKLLGGPQAGIIAGSKNWITLLKRHQLARVLRVDKVTLAALEATLSHYVKGEEEARNIPTVRTIIEQEQHIYERALQFISLMEKYTQYECSLQHSASMIGGGTMPDVELPTYVVILRHISKSTQQLARELRMGTPAVVARIQEEKLMLDFRTVTEGEIETLARCFSHVGI
ncbi:L-seryl-tRNA(Sec) selenium transferase [Microbacteriaceae bacterium 4G12]